MENLFMQVFDHRDWVEAQMRQQVVSYSESLVCTFLAAGRQPPPWLLTHSAFAAETQGNDSPASTLPENNGMDTTETDYHEESYSTASPPLEKEALCSDEANFLEGPHPIVWPLLAKEPTHASETDYHKELHAMASSLHEEATFHRVKINSLEEPHSMPSPQLENEPSHTVEHTETLRSRFLDSSIVESSKFLELHRVKTNSLEGHHCMPSPQLENEPLHTVEHSEALRSRFLDSSIDESSKILEQQSLECHVLPLPCNESSLQPTELADTTSGDPKIFLDTAERNSTTPTNQCLGSLWHEGTEQHIFCVNRAKEINASSCTTVYDKQIQSPRTSAQHLPPSNASGEMVTSFKSDVQSIVSHEDRPTASRIQVQDNSSCERAEVSSSSLMNCQSDCVLNSSSSTMSTLSLDCQDDTHSQMETREILLGNPQPSFRYLSTSGSQAFIPLNLGGKSDANNCKSSEAHKDHLSAYSSPERSMAGPSDVIRCNSPSMKASSCSANTLSSDMSLVPQYSQSSFENTLATVTNSSPSCSHTLSDGDGYSIRKTISCFKCPDADVKTAILEDNVVTMIDCVTSVSGLLSLVDYPSTTSQTTSPSYALYQQSQQACASNESLQLKLSYASNLEFDEEGTDDRQPVSDGAIPWKNGDICVDYDETVQQRQSFSIPIRYNIKSPTIKDICVDYEEGLCDSTKFVNLSCSLSQTYKMDSKMKPLCGVFESLSARFEKLMNQSSTNSLDTKRHDSNYDISKLGVSGENNLEIDGSLLMSNVLTYDAANANSVQEDSEISLTPTVEKYSLDKLSGRTKTSLVCMGSISELACFQIDEGHSITEENENQDKLPRCPSRNYSSQGPAGRKPLEHITSLYQSKEKSASLSTRYVDVGRLGLKTTKAYSKDPDRHLHFGIDQSIKDPKDNLAPSIRKGGVTQPLHDRASRTGILGSKNARHRSNANPEKGWKPSNIVTNIRSFVPLVKQKQQPITACVKKEVRVRALEAAEAAKRRQEKKQIERDMRKVTVELERGRLKQEREQKQKQVDHKKKIDADVVTRKRQREADEKKEDERKKKCIEKARKQQKQQVEHMHAANDGKEYCQKDPDDEEVGKDLVGRVKNQLTSDGMTEPAHRSIASESDKLKAVVAVESFESFGLEVQESFSDDVDESYEMSPYKDSDEEDDEGFEHKEELRRRRKLIPSWAGKENLDKIILSNQNLDPGAIFAHKRSFKLCDVLPLHIPQWRFN